MLVSLHPGLDSHMSVSREMMGAGAPRDTPDGSRRNTAEAPEGKLVPPLKFVYMKWASAGENLAGCRVPRWCSAAEIAVFIARGPATQSRVCSILPSRDRKGAVPFARDRIPILHAADR
jgi:hypothetical protein